ncbi:hypothetical protein QQP08_014037 [Theobroma cacao]|nr:hypothetical protein QQP08_014037 [Theobroma cacao]
MDKALLQPEIQREERIILKKTLRSGTTNFVKELKKLSCMAAPMVTVSVSQYLLQVMSLMMVGHIGELALSGVAIATSFTNVTGFSLLVMLLLSLLLLFSTLKFVFTSFS